MQKIITSFFSPRTSSTLVLPHQVAWVQADNALQLASNGHTAVLTFTPANDDREQWLDITAVKVPRPIQKRAIGERLVQAVCYLAERKGYKLRSHLSYVNVHYLERHPEDRHLFMPSAASAAASPPPLSSSSSSSAASRGVKPTNATIPLPHSPRFGERWACVCQRFQVQVPTTGKELSKMMLDLHGARAGRDVRRACKQMGKFVDRGMEEVERLRFFATTLPLMQRLVLRLPELFPLAEISVLSAQEPGARVDLNQWQIAALIAAAFFSLHAENSQPDRFHDFTFLEVMLGLNLGKQQAKLRCLFHYFDRLAERVGVDDVRIVTFYRHVLPQDSSAFLQQLEDDATPLSGFDLRTDGTIEDAPGMLQADFANKYIGGGVLNTGCVQEEIRFCINPECFAAMLFTEVMEDNEAVLILGAERFSSYTGYARSFAFGGDYRDETPRDSQNRLQTPIVAIDALKFDTQQLEVAQFTEALMVRELYKAYAGFSLPEAVLGAPYPSMATGFWGCGVFHGDTHLKTLLQWIAATLSGRDVVFFTFGRSELQELPTLLVAAQDQHLTAGRLWQLLRAFARKPSDALFQLAIPSILSQIAQDD